MNFRLLPLLILLAVVLFVGQEVFAGSNISPANQSGTHPASQEYKSRQPHSAKSAEQKKEGFWAKEFERSGLKTSKDNAFGGIKKFLDFRGMLKAKEEEYKARQS